MRKEGDVQAAPGQLVKSVGWRARVTRTVFICCFFFFSSRRRHTRCSRDWSSDVCSSDLVQTFDGGVSSSHGKNSDESDASEKREAARMGGGDSSRLRASRGSEGESTNERSGPSMKEDESLMAIAETGRIFYGWWVVAAAFLNLFFVVGIIFYGFPVFYASFVESLGFSRAQVTQGFFLGFLIIGLPFGLLAGAVIDRVGARWAIVSGAGIVGISLLLMAKMTKLWHYEALCALEVLGYVFAGPIANQVLVSRWFCARRGRAMGFAYLGLGSGGVVAPLLVNYLIRTYGWRHALEIVALTLMAVVLPVGIWITRSTPEKSGLLPDGASSSDSTSIATAAMTSSSVAEDW